ncbi:MAG: hypothetical protein RLZ98_802 [Pseudomonadota bacterium]|jgi:uncharacterized membrane protein
MLLLVVGLAVFILIHLVPTAPDIRRSFVERLGEGPYKLVFSLIALVGLVVIVMGYHKLQMDPGKNPIIWDPPIWTRHLNLLLMIPAMIFLVAAYIPSRIRTTLKHPMLIAIKTWALSHLLANGDLGSIVLFGSFLAWAVYDRISVKKRGGGFGPLGTATASSPLNDVAVVLIGLGLYAFMIMWGHTWLIGVPVMPVGN